MRSRRASERPLRESPHARERREASWWCVVLVGDKILKYMCVWAVTASLPLCSLPPPAVGIFTIDRAPLRTFTAVHVFDLARGRIRTWRVLAGTSAFRLKPAARDRAIGFLKGRSRKNTGRNCASPPLDGGLASAPRGSAAALRVAIRTCACAVAPAQCACRPFSLPVRVRADSEPSADHRAHHRYGLEKIMRVQLHIG